MEQLGETQRRTGSAQKTRSDYVVTLDCYSTHKKARNTVFDVCETMHVLKVRCILASQSGPVGTNSELCFLS